jgi:DNA recombination protein RmuC
LIISAAVNMVLLIFLLVQQKNSGKSDITAEVKEMLNANNKEVKDGFAAQRNELAMSFNNQNQHTSKSFFDFMNFLQQLNESNTKANADVLSKLTLSLQDYNERSERKIKELIAAIDEKIQLFKGAMQEENRNSRKEQLEFQERFLLSIRTQFESNRKLLDEKLAAIQLENSQKLDEMKKTVDNKLQQSMEKHFNESFKLISERLEQVHKGLGEMQTLAAGVGDLKKVLTNVKTRGNLGEIQLSTIL